MKKLGNYFPPLILAQQGSPPSPSHGVQFHKHLSSRKNWYLITAPPPPAIWWDLYCTRKVLCFDCFSRSELIHPIDVPFFIPPPIQLLPIFIWNRSTWFALRYSAYLIMLFNQWKLAGVQTNLKQKQNWKFPENFQFWETLDLVASCTAHSS